MNHLLEQLPRIFLPRDHYDWVYDHSHGYIVLLTMLLIPLCGLWLLLTCMIISFLPTELSRPGGMDEGTFVLLAWSIGPVLAALLIRGLIAWLWQPWDG